MKALPADGVALVVDGCLRRSTPLFTRDYFAVDESHALAVAVQKPVRAWLDRHAVRVNAYAEPFVCGLRAGDEDRSASVAPRFDAKPDRTTVPVPRFPAVATDTPRGAALLALFKEAAIYQAPTPARHPPPPIADAARVALRALLKSRYVLVVSADGRYSSTGVFMQNVIVDLVVGQEGGPYDDLYLYGALVDLDAGHGVWGRRPKADRDGNGIDPSRLTDQQVTRAVDDLLETLWKVGR